MHIELYVKVLFIFFLAYMLALTSRHLCPHPPYLACHAGL